MKSTMLLLAVLVASQVKSEGAKWVEATSKDGIFSFAMPARAVEKNVVQQAATGPIDIS